MKSPVAAPFIRRLTPWIGRTAFRSLSGCLLLMLALPAGGFAQGSDAGAYTTARGRLTVGGQASIAVGSNDEGYFNYSTYDYTLLRAVRVEANAEWRAGDRLSLLGDVRVLGSTGGGDWLLRPYAAFARLRPWADRAIHVQAGLVPPVFGAFSRRAYESDNPLIGYPLAYQYLTSLRADALPASGEDLLAMRGRGWLAAYPIGNSVPAEGLPLIDGTRYQSGVELHAGSLQPFEAAVALTSGSLSRPTYERGALGRQASGRFAARPMAGLVLGTSASRGTFVSAPLRDRIGRDAGSQSAFGFDVEYSRDHWIVRSEGVYSRWRVPGSGFVNAPLTALAIDLEGRYRLRPGLYVAVRADRLRFGSIRTAPGGTLTPWEYPVRRVEVGAGYTFWRNVLLKVAYQRNHRTSGAQPLRGAHSYDTLGLGSAQLVVWF